MDNHRGEPEPADGREPPGVADGDLLRQFVATRDEQAFGELVRRYSCVVLSVCRRTLHDGHDAEEAFQATFFVLAKKAAQVRVGRGLGPWLYGVAYRVALRAAEKRARRRETALPDDMIMLEDALQSVTECHWRRVLDDELNQLPEKYRNVVVLHYLLGRTNKEVAAELGLSVRTVEGRQRRGKELLKRRLMLRKVSLPLALGVLAKTQAASANAAAPLVEATIEASLSFAHGNSAACSADAVRLAQSEVLAMTSSVAPVSATLITLIALGAGIALAGGDAAVQGDAGLSLAKAALTLAAADAEAPTPLAADGNPFDINPQTGEPQAESGGSSTATDQPAAESDTSGKSAEQQSASSGPMQAEDLFKRSDAERKILTTLQQPLRNPLAFMETPLRDVSTMLSEEYSVPILFDMRALDAVAATPDMEVSIEISDVPLRSALRLLLDQIEYLTYIVRDDVLMITTEEVAESMLETHVYDVAHLVANPADLIELKTAILEAVCPGTWQESGQGAGAITTLRDSMLVVSQSQSGHEEIAKFLQQLEALKK